MGGSGSGRKCKNELTSDYFRLDVRKLAQGGFLVPHRTGRWLLRRSGSHVATLWFTFERSHLTGNLDLGRDLFGERRTRFLLEVRWSSCNYGGVRPWFLCPGKGCALPAAILYGKEDFLCRNCRTVSYPLERVPPISRAIARLQNLRVRLGGSVDLTIPFPEKPKGMHTQTYLRLWIRSRRLEAQANDDFGTWVEGVKDRRNSCQSIKP